MIHGAINLQCIPTPVLFCGSASGAVISLAVVRAAGVDTLTWSISDASGLDSFLVCRTRSGYFYPAVEGFLPIEATVGVGTLSYTFSDMDTWDDYQVVGRAYGFLGPYSPTVRAPATAPAVVSGLAIVDEDGLIRLNWTRNDNRATSFLINDAFEGAALALLDTISPVATYLTGIGWGGGQRAFRVDAVNAAGTGTGTVGYTTPDSPNISNLTDTGLSHVSVDFSHPAQGGGGWIDSYVLQRNTDGLGWVTVATIATPATATYDDDTGQSSGSSILYRIKAVKGDLSSAWAQFPDAIVIVY